MRLKMITGHLSRRETPDSPLHPTPGGARREREGYAGRMSEMNRDDIEAALEVRREQGAAIEPALVDSMARKIEATVRRRYEAEVITRQGRETSEQADRKQRTTVAITSLALAIPLSAIAGGIAGLVGILVVWVGIVLVNMAVAMRRPPQR
jgi:hypothetical protein